MTGMTSKHTDWRHAGLVTLAVGYQWFYNGANFLAFKVARNALHPPMVATPRFFDRGNDPASFRARRWRRSSPSARELGGAALIGVIMLVASQARRFGGRFPAGRSSRGVRLCRTALPGAVRRGLFHRSLSFRQVAGVTIGLVGLAL